MRVSFYVRSTHASSIGPPPFLDPQSPGSLALAFYRVNIFSFKKRQPVKKVINCAENLKVAHKISHVIDQSNRLFLFFPSDKILSAINQKMSKKLKKVRFFSGAKKGHKNAWKINSHEIWPTIRLKPTVSWYKVTITAKILAQSRKLEFIINWCYSQNWMLDSVNNHHGDLF